ncbi:MAG: hypothetical protein JSS21_07355 [Proteobacteria bacterium]|nr:hypothetical protein [Pseudomonadota bacterium]
MAAAAVAAVVLFGAGMLAGGSFAVPGGAASRASELARRNDDLQARLAVLQRDRQVSQIADRVLQKNLAERDEEIRSLRADQAFYSRLVGVDAQPGGLTVHGLAVSPVARTHAWNFTVTLTHSAEGAKEIQGVVNLSVEGVHADKLATLAWSDLAGANAGTGIPFDFKYFQQVQGTLLLPADFTPNRINVRVQPRGSATVIRSLSWGEATQGNAAGMP